MQIYECVWDPYTDPEQLQFDKEKLAHSQAILISRRPVWEKEEAEQEITRLETDILERTNLILNLWTEKKKEI